MTTNDTVITEVDEERAELVREWLALEERLEPLNARVTDIKARLEELPVGTMTVPGVAQRVQVTQARTFKPALFAAAHPPTSKANLKYYGLTVDAAKVKDSLPPAELEQYKAPSKKSVKLV